MFFLAPLTVSVGFDESIGRTEDRMIDLATVEGDVQIAHEQCHIGPVVIETAAFEHGIGAIHIGYQIELTILEEIAIFEHDILGIPQFHNAIGTIVDIGAEYGQTFGLTCYQSIGTTTIEVARNDIVVFTAHHSYHPTLAGTSFGMPNSKVFDFAILAIDEIEAVCIARLNLNAGVLPSADDEVFEVLQRQLMTVTTRFTNDGWGATSSLYF
jgi:hypothetical protein